MINPIHAYRQDDEQAFYPDHVGNMYPIQMIEFDIAVTVEQEDKTKASIGVVASFIGLGIQGQDNRTNSEISRVKFSVPVLFSLEKQEL